MTDTTVLMAGEVLPLPAAFAGAIVVAPATAAAPVPGRVSRAQALDAMARHMLSDGRALDDAMEADVQTALAATAALPGDDEDRLRAKRTAIWWHNAQVFERDHPMLLAAADRYGLTAAQVDDLFRAAAGV